MASSTSCLALTKAPPLTKTSSKRPETGEKRRLPLYQKLLLNGAMTGNEACVAFEQLYSVPLLQTLGVPVTYVSLYPLVSGPLTIILMILLGHLSDKGASAGKRKMALVAFNSFILLSSMSLLIAANSVILLLDSHRQDDIHSNNTLEVTGTGYLTNSTSCFSTTTLPSDLNNTLVNWTQFPANRSSLSMTEPQSVPTAGSHTNSSSTDEESLVFLPATGLLGLAGMGLLDVGYDLNIAATKSCVLSNSCHSDHASLLVLGLGMAALGGCITDVCGLVDMAETLHLGTSDRSLVVQTTVQLAVCCLVLVLGLTSTIITALLNSRRLNDDKPLNDTDHETAPHYGATDSSLRSNVTEDSSVGDLNLTTADAEHSKEAATQSDGTENNQPLQCQKKRVTRQDSSPAKPRKCNLVIACVSVYLGTTVLFSYNIYSSDFLGKVVMKGDPSAPKDSSELKAYASGVDLAAGGLLLCYCCYVMFSAVHGRLLDFWGLKIDFCLTHVLMATSILTLTLTEHVAAYYVTSVLYSFQRAALLTVPFIVANNFTQEQQKAEGEGSSVGRAMAVVSCMVPLNICTLYLLSGPLITLTHYDGAPLLVASGATYLAALAFFMYRR